MKIGFIGSGNMATAIMSGIINSNLAKPCEITAYDISTLALEKVKNDLQVEIATNNEEVVQKSEIVFLAVKPMYYSAVIAEIKEFVTENQIIVSIAPGITVEKLECFFGKEIKLMRTMPNTPAIVGEGMTAYCPNKNMSESDTETVVKILSSFGKCALVAEYLIDAVVGISGSSPAYVYMFIEALGDAGVRGGMARDVAYQFAAQAVLGSAKMVLETGLHPAKLKDMVCSPAGTTIEAVAKLEETGFRNSVISAVDVCVKKSKSMG